MSNIKRLKCQAESNIYTFESTILIIDEDINEIKDASLENSSKYNCKYDGKINALLKNIDITNDINESLKQCMTDKQLKYSYDIINGTLHSKIESNKKLLDDDINSCINILEYSFEDYDKLNQGNLLDEYSDGGITFLLYFNESKGYYIKQI